MALGTITRCWRGVKKSSDSPSRHIVAVRALPSKQFPVRIAIAVTTCAHQSIFLGVLRPLQSKKVRDIGHHLA